jgi:hypothetical protein
MRVSVRVRVIVFFAIACDEELMRFITFSWKFLAAGIGGPSLQPVVWDGRLDYRGEREIPTAILALH